MGASRAIGSRRARASSAGISNEQWRQARTPHAQLGRHGSIPLRARRMWTRHSTGNSMPQTAAHVLFWRRARVRAARAGRQDGLAAFDEPHTPAESRSSVLSEIPRPYLIKTTHGAL